MDNQNGNNAAPNVKKGRRAWIALGGSVMAALAIGGLWYLIYARWHESTDDAEIDAHVATVATRIPGQVIRIYFDNNQHVRKGDILVDLDPSDYRVARDEARAALEAALARSQRAALDEKRMASLFRKNQVSKQEYDHTVQDARAAKADADLSKWRLDQAELNLSYCRIASPETGTVDKRAVEVGNYVSAGQAVMAVVPREVWVTANFKETQLGLMRPGQRVKIYIDTYPDHVFHGHVDSIQRGTGAAFSLMPPENATGNFVKVVQRVPVKIVFDSTDGYWLAPGMSAEPVVDLKYMSSASTVSLTGPGVRPGAL